MDRLGLDQDYRGRTGCTLYTLEMHMHYLREIKAAATVSVEVSILGADHKRIHAAFDLLAGSSPEPAASAEVMLLHVRQAAQVSSQPFAPQTATAIEQLRQLTASLPPARHGSRQIQLPQH